MVDVITVQHLGDYRLHVAFSDGTEGDLDLRERIERSRGPEAICGLRDPALFRRAAVEDGTVTWPNGADFAAEYIYALAHGLEAPRTLEDAQRNELEMSLRELRTASDLNQQELAARLGVSQGAVSRLEANAARAELTTIRKVVKALGWDVEVVAVRGDHRVRLRGI